ncbi:hypothetical protein FALB51S_02436 [Frigidibacter albus]
MSDVNQDCVIAGGGPAGMMAALLLAWGGVRVTVLEQHPDFLRDFRGDTIHPSTLQLMAELGWLEEFLRLPHQKAPDLHAEIAGRQVTIADFSRLPLACRYIAFMPQWDFLNFLAMKGRDIPGFTLLMGHRITQTPARGWPGRGAFMGKRGGRAGQDPRAAGDRGRRAAFGGACRGGAGGDRLRFGRRCALAALDAPAR